MPTFISPGDLMATFELHGRQVALGQEPSEVQAAVYSEAIAELSRLWRIAQWTGEELAISEEQVRFYHGHGDEEKTLMTVGKFWQEKVEFLRRILVRDGEAQL